MSPHGLFRLTPMSDRDVYIIFSVLILKTYMYYVFNIYMYYKRNTGGLYIRPGSILLEKVFRSACDVLKEIDPQTDFQYMRFINYFLTNSVLFYI